MRAVACSHVQAQNRAKRGLKDTTPVTALQRRELSISAIAVMSAARPLFPHEQTFAGTHRTAVSCHNRTRAPQRKSLSFDNIIGAREQCRRQFETERLGGLEIDEQLNLCGLLDRQISQLFAL